MFDLKSKSLKYNELVASASALRNQKRGDPKNAGESRLIYENKGEEKTGRGESRLVIANKQVIRFLLNVDENKGS